MQRVADEWGVVPEEGLPRLAQELREVARLPGMRAIHHQMFDGLNLHPGASVLEVGCGPWLWGSMLRQYVGPAALLAGIDLYYGLVAGVDEPNVFVADARHLPFQSRSFDAVFCSRLLTHVGPTEVLIDEMMHVTRRGGMIGAFEWTFSQWEIEDDNGPISDAIHHALVDNHYRPAIGVELPDLLREMGLSGVTAIPYLERITDAYDSPLTLDLIRRHADLVIATGEFPAEDVEAWYSAILQRAAEGRFALTRTGLASWGIV